MSFALKRKFPHVYNILKKFEKYVPAVTKLWDKKNYLVNLKIVSMLRKQYVDCQKKLIQKT